MHCLYIRSYCETNICSLLELTLKLTQYSLFNIFILITDTHNYYLADVVIRYLRSNTYIVCYTDGQSSGGGVWTLICNPEYQISYTRRTQCPHCCYYTCNRRTVNRLLLSCYTQLQTKLMYLYCRRTYTNFDLHIQGIFSSLTIDTVGKYYTINL